MIDQKLIENGEILDDFTIECLSEALTFKALDRKLISRDAVKKGMFDDDTTTVNTDEYFKEKIEKDSSKPIRSISQVIDRLTTWVSDKYKNRHILIKSLSAEILNRYKKIGELLNNDRELRKENAEKEVTGTYYQLYIIHEKNNKQYRFQYAQLNIPYDQILRMIRGAMAGVSSSKDYTELQSVLSQVDEFLNGQYWYVKETKIMLAKSKPIVGSMENHIMETKRGADNIYALLYNETWVLSMNNYWTGIVQKAYGEASRLCSSDKQAMKIVDDIFNHCLDYLDAALKWNFNGLNLGTIILSSYAEQMEKFYDIMKK